MARSEAPAWRKPPANGYPLSPTATAPVADSTPLLLEGHHLVIHPKGRPGPWYQMASIEIGAGEVAHIAPPLWWREQKREVKGFRLSGGLFRPPLLGEEQEQGTDIGYWSSLHRTIAGLESALGYAGWRPRAGRAHFPMAAACCRKRRRGTGTWLFRGMCCLPCRGNTYPCQPAEKHPLRHPIRRGTSDSSGAWAASRTPAT